MIDHRNQNPDGMLISPELKSMLILIRGNDDAVASPASVHDELFK